MPSFYEFFAGGGMARAGLGDSWQCLLANDIDPKKTAVYAANWGDQGLIEGDVAKLSISDLPGRADLAWASFPCQDLSLAGAGRGLYASRSGNFWPFWDLVSNLVIVGRAPKLIVLENVCGALTSHNGKDFSAIGKALTSEGYRFGALVIDAVHFVPQSRPRLFIVGVRRDMEIPQHLVSIAPVSNWHISALRQAYDNLQKTVANHWIWWKLPQPKPRTTTLEQVIEATPPDAPWQASVETKRLVSMMSPVNRKKLEQAMGSDRRIVGTIYKRTRLDKTGKRVQRAEVRFDGVAGCLRTPAGGSSRQTLIVVDGKKVRTRLLSSREAARLMGLPDSYRLPDRYNDGYHLIGDGLAVPVVQYLTSALLEPLLLLSGVIEA